jgi:hypothetical protein
VCSPFSLLADHECNCDYCELELDFEEPIDYEELGEYEGMFREFEEKIEEEEGDLDVECGVFKKWGKKLKRWFKKRVVDLIKKCVDLEKIRNAEDCAYTVADFKRKADKIHNTGSIEKMFKDFDDRLPDNAPVAGFEHFKSRVKYYYNNKKARSPKNKSFDVSNLNIEHRKPEYNGELDDIPTRALIGGAEIACGSLIAVLPFPGCAWLGWTLIGHGSTQIYEAYMNEYEKQYNNSPHEVVDVFQGSIN